jgi:hypothetical protein
VHTASTWAGIDLNAVRHGEVDQETAVDDPLDPLHHEGGHVRLRAC